MPLQVSLTPAQIAALNTVVRSRAPANKMRYHYYLDGIDLTDYMQEATWGRTGVDTPARVFTGRFKTSLPESLKNGTITVNLEVETAVGSIVFRRFTGRVDELVVRRGRTTVEAQSGGFWLDKIRFDEDGVSYADVAPSDVVWDVVTRAAASGVYDLGFTDIERVEGPKVRRDEFLAITRIDKLSRPLDAAVEEGELFFRDSPYNSPLCHRDRGPAEATEILHEYVVGIDIEPDDFEPAATSDQFYDVIGYRTTEDGSIEFLFDPILIPGSNAPRGVGYEISATDATDTGSDDVYALAQKAAGRLIHGESTVRFPVRWPHPTMVDGDFVSVLEPFEDGMRAGTRYWIAEVEVATEHHDYTVELDLTMVRQRETEEAVPVVSALPLARVRGR